MEFLLSPREKLVVQLAGEGLTDKEISKKTGLSSGTISTYWERVRSKTSSTSRTEAVVKVLSDTAASTARAATIANLDRDDTLARLPGQVLFSLDLHGNITNWTKSVLHVLGFMEEEFVGENFSMTFTPDDAEAGRPGWQLGEAVTRGYVCEGRYLIRHDGRQIWVEGTLVAHYDDENSVRAFSIVLQDETEKKDLEEEVNKLKRIIAEFERGNSLVVLAPRPERQ